MEHSHEIIPFSTQVPGKIILHKLGNVPRHWHRSLEILIILSGSVDVSVEDRQYTLGPTDICVINSLSPHEIYSSNAEAVAFQTNPAKTAFSSVLKNSYFECCSAGDTNNPKYNRLRHFLARLIKENASEENLLVSYSLIAQLLYELQSNFSVPMPDSMDGKRNALSQMGQITDYMMQHYRENLSLHDVADQFHYSPSYLSRFFKQNLNMTFLDFYTSIRLESAVNDLLSGKESINVIAANNGFPSSRSFVTVFQKKYGMLPSEYRAKQPRLVVKDKAKTEVNYLAVTNSSSLSALAPFLQETASFRQADEKLSMQSVGNVNVLKKTRTLRHTWKNVCCVGSSRDLLYANVRDMLTTLQREIGYKYVKFHGVLSDDLLLCDVLSDGSVNISFVLFDQIIDYLLSIGLKPWMQLGFMPRALASNPERNSFFTRQNCSLPEDREKWLYLVESTVRHCIDRYSLEEVLSWPFAIWNEPDTTVDMFGFKNKEEFFYFYTETFERIKSVNKDIKIGTPSLLFLLDDPLDWYTPFFEHCIKERCFPDFFNLHYYDDDITLENVPGSAEHRERLINRLNMNPHAFSDFLDGLTIKFTGTQLENLPLYMTEWNLTVSHRNLLNDTCFKACYLTKNLLENYDRIESFGYWSLTDLIGESQLPATMFHGGLGMFTTAGIPKAHYYTFKMLTKLGDALVAQGDGWFLTRHSSSGKLAMIIYNYSHFNSIISQGELFDMTPTDRYTPFSQMSKKEFSIQLEGIESEEVLIKETFVNRNCGSSYDNWVKMGGHDILTDEDIETLKHISYPGRHVENKEQRNGHLSYSCVLEPLEVRLVEIEPVIKNN